MALLAFFFVDNIIGCGKEKYMLRHQTANIYLFKVNNRDTRTRCEISSKLNIKTPKRRQCCSGVFTVNFEHITHLFLLFLLLNLNKKMFTGQILNLFLRGNKMFKVDNRNTRTRCKNVQS